MPADPMRVDRWRAPPASSILREAGGGRGVSAVPHAQPPTVIGHPGWVTGRHAVRIQPSQNSHLVAELRWEWAYEDDRSVGPWLGDTAFAAAVASWLDDERRTLWTAGTDDMTVGMVCLTEHARMPSPRQGAGGRWGYLGHLYVRPAFRGSGIGRELVRHTVATADGRGYAKVVLNPTEASTDLYKQCGFTAENDLMVRRP